MPQLRFIVFGEPLWFKSFEFACSQEQVHSSLFGITDCLSTADTWGHAGSWACPAKDLVPPEMTSKCHYLLICREGRVIHSVRFVLESIFPVACWFCSETFQFLCDYLRTIIQKSFLLSLSWWLSGTMSWFLCLPLFEGIFPERIFGLYCFPPSANLLSCPNSLFSISFIGKALHGSYVEVWQHLVCFCVPGQPPHASLSWELQGLSFFWTLTVSLSPREKRNTQRKAGRVIWSLVLGAVAVQLASKFKTEGKLLSWNKSFNLLLHLTLF